jgi:hypothetical protein
MPTIIFTLALLISSAHASLNDRYLAERASPSPEVRTEVAQLLQTRKVVFAVLGDRLFAGHKSFQDNAGEVKALGGTTAFVSSGFFVPYEVNAPALATALKSAYDGKPFVIVANPQTGPEVLYAVLRDPSVLPLIDKIVLTTPAFGTPLVDRTDAADPGLLDFIRDTFGENLRKFRIDGTLERFNEAIRAAGDAVRTELAAKTYYVRGAASSVRGVTPFLRAPYRVLHKEGDTDSVTFTKDQQLAALGGNDLGVLDVDHWDLWAAEPFANSPASDRRAFIRALIMELYHPAAK